MASFVKTRYLIILLLLSTITFFVVDNMLTKEVQVLKTNKYKLVTKNLQNRIKNELEKKSISTLNIAIALSENSNLKEFLKGNKTLKTNLKKVSLKIREYSDYKNIWIQIINNKGISKFRSWSSKKNDNIARIRKEIPILLRNPKIFRVISVGIFDMTFKSIVPIYEDKKFLGFIEIITKMNSIAQDFKKQNLDLLVLADKKYKKQIKKPFTKDFINDYYVANYNAKKELKELVKKDIDKYINNKSYLLNHNSFISTYILKDIEGENLGYFIISKKLDTIDITDIIEFENFIKLIGILILIILLSLISLFYYYNKTKYTNLLEKNVKKRTSEIKELTKKYQQIFEDSKAMKVIIDPETQKIIEANESAINFYGYSKKEFLNLTTKDLNKLDKQVQKDTMQKVINAEENVFYFKHLLANGEFRDVEVYASPIEIDNKILIYSIIKDITSQLKTKKELQEKEHLFYQQAKMASMGEMLENIAHQWRQPLSIISTAASGAKIKKEFGELDDEFLFESIDLIVKSSNYLSHTIDDFRNFFRQNNKKEEFKLLDTIHNSIKLSNIKNRAIDIDLHCDDIKIIGFKNELIQVLLNIINNSKYALDEKKVENKLIRISVKELSAQVQISITDNAGGIQEDKITRVFEPYFTTKHQSQGTGIGLYMCEQIITKHFNGQILVQNVNLKYKEQDYFGASIKITLPLN